MPFPWSGAGTAYALYLMRAGKPGSFRHELYNFLPLGGRGVFLVIGIFSGSLGATQYYAYRNSMERPPETDLDRELRSAKTSAVFKSGKLLLKVRHRYPAAHLLH